MRCKYNPSLSNLSACHSHLLPLQFIHITKGGKLEAFVFSISPPIVTHVTRKSCLGFPTEDWGLSTITAGAQTQNPKRKTNIGFYSDLQVLYLSKSWFHRLAGERSKHPEAGRNLLSCTRNPDLFLIKAPDETWRHTSDNPWPLDMLN